MEKVLFAFMIGGAPSYLLASMIAYILLGFSISALSALGLYRMVIDKSKNLQRDADRDGFTTRACQG